MKTKPVANLLLACIVLLFIFPLTPVAIASDIILTLEEPISNSTYSGVSNIRGWAIAPSGIEHIELFIDGTFLTNIPSGGSRKDVGDAYPTYPNSDQSGFSMAFNYSNLTKDQHTIAIRAIDNNGDSKETWTTFNITRFEIPFIADPGSISLIGANVSNNDTSISIQDLLASGRRYNILLEWRTAIQGFAVTQIVPKDSGIVSAGLYTGMTSQNTGCRYFDIHPNDSCEVRLNLKSIDGGKIALSPSPQVDFWGGISSHCGGQAGVGEPVSFMAVANCPGSCAGGKNCMYLFYICSTEELNNGDFAEGLIRGNCTDSVCSGTINSGSSACGSLSWTATLK